MLICPALTMRLFSEERQSGMWDLIRTKPVSLPRIVLGKYFAAWTLVLIGLLPCFVHYFVVAYMAEPMGNLDSGAFLGSFIGLILLSGTFLALGLLCATFSKSQIVCFITGALTCFILYWVLLQDHYSSLSRGVLDLRDVTFFVFIAVIAIIAAIFTIDRLTRK
jgi:ABC-2 type transport system permease protein